MFTVYLAKEMFKFSCSHFTIFSAEHAEPLHGHNYQMRVDLETSGVDPQLGLAFDFNAIKPIVRALCDEWDERILLPARSPFVALKEDGSQIEMRFRDRFYSLPKNECVRLPVVNITAEELARYSAERLKEGLAAVAGWISLRVHVEETRGQSVSFFLAR